VWSAVRLDAVTVAGDDAESARDVWAIASRIGNRCSATPKPNCIYTANARRARSQDGHINVLSENADGAFELANALFATLSAR